MIKDKSLTVKNPYMGAFVGGAIMLSALVGYYAGYNDAKKEFDANQSDISTSHDASIHKIEDKVFGPMNNDSQPMIKCEMKPE